MKRDLDRTRPLDGLTALVTGAGRGIGRGIAHGLAEAGASVAVADLDRGSVVRVSSELEESGSRSMGITLDVTVEEEVTARVTQVEQELGPISILVNNAAIDEAILLEDMTLTQWRVMLDTNLTSVFLCTRAVLPGMRGRQFGRIINIGSQLAIKGGVKLAHYCAAKAGVHGFTRAVALESAPFGITVNTVAPGPIETDMLWSLPDDWLAAKRAELPLGRFGTVDEIVPAVVLLASPGGAYFTGATLNISGGDVID